MANIACDRIEQIRKWFLTLLDFKGQGIDGLSGSPEHAKRILSGKNLHLFDETTKQSGSPDQHLAANVAMGFDLMEDIFSEKFVRATLPLARVREMASISRQTSWQSTYRSNDTSVAAEVYKATMEERDQRWLTGPFTPQEVPEKSVLTRRFGVQQPCALGNGSTVLKTRPIDDYSEPLVKYTSSCVETIQPMSIDMILAALAMRFRICGPERLVGKAVDLRKA